MSNNALYLKTGFPTANVCNGVGRFIPQLKRITFKFCKSNGNSRGVRDFLERDLIDLAKAFPSVAIYCKPRRHRQPVVTAEYLDGTTKWMNFNKMEREEIIQWVGLLMKQSSGESIRLTKKQVTSTPSIQGVWAPYTYADPHFNILKIPDETLSKPVFLPQTATEKLIELFKKQEEAARKEEQIMNASEQKV